MTNKSVDGTFRDGTVFPASLLGDDPAELFETINRHSLIAANFCDKISWRFVMRMSINAQVAGNRFRRFSLFASTERGHGSDTVTRRIV